MVQTIDQWKKINSEIDLSVYGIQYMMKVIPKISEKEKYMPYELKTNMKGKIKQIKIYQIICDLGTS